MRDLHIHSTDLEVFACVFRHNIEVVFLVSQSEFCEDEGYVWVLEHLFDGGNPRRVEFETTIEGHYKVRLDERLCSGVVLVQFGAQLVPKQQEKGRLIN